MQLVRPSIEFLEMTSEPLMTIECAGRTCYKSEERMIDGHSSKEFVRMLLKRGHEAMIEHAYASYRVVCDRGVTHEIVRHRLCSYAQESTRYCNYSGGVTFIIPRWMGMIEGEYLVNILRRTVHVNGVLKSWHFSSPETTWLESMTHCEEAYKSLLADKWTPQQARSVLPNSLKTEIVITTNLREWRHFFKLRTAKAAHPQMREVADMLLKDMRERIPVIFEDVE